VPEAAGPISWNATCFKDDYITRSVSSSYTISVPCGWHGDALQQMDCTLSGTIGLFTATRSNFVVIISALGILGLIVGIFSFSEMWGGR